MSAAIALATLPICTRTGLPPVPFFESDLHATETVCCRRLLQSLCITVQRATKSMASTKPAELDGPSGASDPEAYGGGDADKSAQEGGAAAALPVESASQDKGKEKVVEEGSAEEKTAPDSRRTLLDDVRKHSDSLLHPALATKAVQADGESEGGSKYWKDLVDTFFVRGAAKGSKAQDDMLFFVRKHSVMLEDRMQLADELGQLTPSGVQGPGRLAPFFVKRWQPDLSSVLGKGSSKGGPNSESNQREFVVDWRRTFYLNLIAHTTFALTVAVCSRKALELHRKAGGAPVTPLYKVTKTVYASPSRARIDMDTSKASQTTPAYPDICFAVDDYDDTFDSVVISDPDHCFCVLLNANGGAAFSGSDHSGTPRTSKEANVLEETGTSPKVTLFSGFVGYDLVKEAFNSGRGRMGGLFTATSGRAERLVMRGPGGRGEADVAVSGVRESEGSSKTKADKTGGEEPQPSTDDDASSPTARFEMEQNKKRLGFGDFAKKAAAAAATTARNLAQVYLAATQDVPDETNLKCCLMSLTISWEALAHDLLFKELPGPPAADETKE
ncbi:hypothetical protein KFL_006590070 [Klebsormidium nitens]|uniref:Uncharacterized protein n=1 Tax=Klebsormidium nitens TaxID=105231 RepID=A0A1Y1IIG8_KLENI|nr:hypothetical protein KFL_006590070 [Klebsormidium nitens]|eukprot:GAQ90594.1 hypothetical protein KFL_006590070 [Klebsormidium nitens]